ncbi:MAG: amidase [Flavobacterium sp.]|jgi:amidase
MYKIITGVLFALASQSVAAESAIAKSPSFNIIEATLGSVHKAIQSGELSCEQLTREYIQRIQLLDQSSGLNSIILVNPKAMLRARELDNEYARSEILKDLHCAPIIVKDNYLTKGLQTSVGSKAMQGFIPDEDAWQVKKLKQAGALVLAKSNMAEWAFSPRVTISSIAGETKNPYNLNYSPAGSSGGTAAAVAANFGLIGLGTDTGNSIRGPSSHNGLVGIRSTMGLTSRTGIAPLYSRHDVGGPIARTVKDATRILQVISGFDPEDKITKNAKGRKNEELVSLLREDALKDVRIGVLRDLNELESDPEILKVFDAALVDLERFGATIVKDIQIENFSEISQGHWCRMFRHDLNNFLIKYGKNAPVKNLSEIVSRGNYSEYIADDIKAMLAIENPRSEGRSCDDIYKDKRRVTFRNAIVEAMDKFQVAAIVYPSWRYSPARLGHPEEYRGDNSQIIAPHTGLPAITVPMGYVEGLPAGLQFLGRLYAEPSLLPLVYAYEQGTLHRKAPQLFTGGK